MQIMHLGPCISCITQNTSHPQLSQYLRSAIHKPQKYLFTTLWLFSWNSYIPNQTGISEIFRAHSLRRLLVVPRLVWGESVSVRGKRERRESETLVFKTGWMWKFECVCGHRQAVPVWVAQPRSPQHTRHVSVAPRCHFGRRSYFYFEHLHFTKNAFRSSSPWHLEEDNCSWHICGWAPTLDKDYCRYKSWTMAPLLAQN